MKINKTLYYVLNCTWGCILTLCGALVAAILMALGYKPKRWGGCIYFNIGKNWGGLELGLVFLCDEGDSLHIKNHEYGHSIQNMMFGPFTLLISFFPSVIRYWYRELFYIRRGKCPKTSYDDIWFEGTATKWGTETLSQWQ